eukprot:TRINITY_DN8903_c0_g1_i1.p1 TRINITY_DN8903_c0_g1~~TRINITY_DN8903_c0_g1_i1.p1  ORF type:complete len:198 (-),score=41.25 TRINITY_DN8903_c0_g1_i1:256-849(-)
MCIRDRYQRRVRGRQKRRMGGCCSATGACAVITCGIVFQLVGSGLLAYDIYYFIDKSVNNLAYCVLGLAIANILAGILAFCYASRGKSKCLCISYCLTLCLLIALEATVGVMLKVDEEATKEWLTSNCSQDHGCSSSMKSAEQGFDKHQDTFFYAVVSLIGFKVVAILLACCHNSTSKHPDGYQTVNTSDWGASGGL